MLVQESILSSAGPSSAASNASGPGTITLHDISNGTTLASFKQTSAGRHCTAVVETKDGLGGFMLAAQSEKSILNVYNFQRDQLALKIVLPEKLTCIAIDARGDYCVGGTAQGRIYLWEVASGILFNVWDAHYRAVNVLRFTRDGSAFVSGSEDSGVSVWSMSRLLANELQNDLPVPYCTLSDHTLPITDVVVGIGPFPSCRVLTASNDHSVKLWDLSSAASQLPSSRSNPSNAQCLLSTFIFPHPISCLALEITERAFFAATSEGTVYQVNLFRHRETQHSRQMEAIGGGGVSAPIRIDGDGDKSLKRAINVGHTVTAISTSLTSSTLLVGTASGTIHLYDVASHQLLRTINNASLKGHAITHLQTLLRPSDLIGHVSASLGSGGGVVSVKEVEPTRPIVPFQRIRDVKAREAHEVLIALPGMSQANLPFPSSFSIPTPAPDPSEYSTSELLRDHAFFVPHLNSNPLTPSSSSPSNANSNSAASAAARLAELEAETQHLREQLGRAKAVNDAMWEAVVQSRAKEAKEAGSKGRGRNGRVGDSEDGGEDVDMLKVVD